MMMPELASILKGPCVFEPSVKEENEMLGGNVRNISCALKIPLCMWIAYEYTKMYNKILLRRITQNTLLLNAYL